MLSEPRFVEIYDQYRNLVYKVAFSYLRVKEEAENILQDVFLKLYYHPPKDESNLPGWLIKVTQNLSLDTIKKKKKETLVLSQTKRDQDLQTETKEIDVLFYLNQLPEKYAHVLKLFYYGHLNIKEIAKALNKSESNIKKMLERGRKQLKNLLEGAKL